MQGPLFNFAQALRSCSPFGQRLQTIAQAPQWQSPLPGAAGQRWHCRWLMPGAQQAVDFETSHRLV